MKKNEWVIPIMDDIVNELKKQNNLIYMNTDELEAIVKKVLDNYPDIIVQNFTLKKEIITQILKIKINDVKIEFNLREIYLENLKNK